MSAPTLDRPITVGVVEDSDEDFAVFSRVLNRHPRRASVTRWVRAEAVLESLEQGRIPSEIKPDVLVVDLSLPGIDGCELVRRLRQDPVTGDVPVFMLSGSGRQRDIDRCYEAGATAYFRKSGSSTDLRALLDTILETAGSGASGAAPPNDTPRYCAASVRSRARGWVLARRSDRAARPTVRRHALRLPGGCVPAGLVAAVS